MAATFTVYPFSIFMLRPALRPLAFVSILAAGITAAPRALSAQGGAVLAQPTDTVLGRQIRSMERITLAHRLAVHGQRARQPLALITAAEILIDNPTRPLGPSSQDTVGAVIPDPARLLASARSIAGADERLIAIIGPVERRARSVDRGSARGPRQLYGQVAAASRREHTVEFRGGEPAVIYVSGDGDSDLDLFVYDEAGQLVASATGPRDECVVRWQPERQGRFRVEVRNLGGASNWDWMATN
jgi:hypothetical protein